MDDNLCDFCRTVTFQKLSSTDGMKTSIRAVLSSSRSCPCCSLLCKALGEPIRLHKKRDGLHLKTTADSNGQYHRVRLATSKHAGDLTISAAPRANLSYLPITRDANMTAANEWLSACEHGLGHEKCHNEYTGLFKNQRRLRVLDVDAMCLVHITPFSEPYVALSYVWGANISIKTKRSNVDQYTKALPVPLPLVYSQSIEIVRAFGMRYLWIDALCIIQDDAADVSMHINSMDQTYAEARFTIAALIGGSAESGLNLRRPSSWAPVSVEIPSAAGVLRLEESIGSIHPDIDNTVWIKRGWTFQERLLSRRLLMFTNKHMMFQCRLETRREDGLRSLNGYSPALDDGVPAPLSINHYDRWPHVVEELSARSVTNPMDLIPAVTGIANIVHRRYGATIVSGLCSQNLHTELLWQAAEDTRLEKVSRSLHPNVEEILSKSVDRFKNPVIPTWSWARWIGPVKYDLMRVESTPVAKISTTEVCNSQDEPPKPALAITAPMFLITHRKALARDIEDMELFPSDIYSVMYSESTPNLRIASIDGMDGGWLVFDEGVNSKMVRAVVLSVNSASESRNVLLLEDTNRQEKEYRRTGIGEIGKKAWDTLGERLRRTGEIWLV